MDLVSATATRRSLFYTLYLFPLPPSFFGIVGV